MLSKLEFKDYCTNHNVCKSALQYIIDVRESEPSRMVGRFAVRNTISYIFSKKMNHTIQSESRTAERIFVMMQEYNENTFEIWDQLKAVYIKYTDKNQKIRGRWYKSDYLLLTQDGPYIFEVKHEDEIVKLLKEKKNDWVTINNEITFLPAKKYFESIGLQFKVFIAKKTDKIIDANLRLIVKNRSENIEPKEIDNDLIKKIYNDKFYYSLYDLGIILKEPNYSNIINLIDNKSLFFNYDSELLANDKSCHITNNIALLDVVREYTKDTFTTDINSAISIELVPNSKSVLDALSKLNNVKIFSNLTKEEKIKSDISERSIRRYNKSIKDGLAEGLTPLQALIPKYHMRGNRNSYIPTETKEFTLQHIKEFALKNQKLTKKQQYLNYLLDFEKEFPSKNPNEESVGLNSYIGYFNQLPKELIAKNEGGRKKGNSVAPASNPETRSFLAMITWESASIDHCNVKIYLIYLDNNGTIFVAKPWISVLIDNHSKHILAFSVSFEPPSRKSCARLLRRCVQKWGKLPNEIFSDRGSDFTSVYFASLLAHYGIDLSHNPAGFSRYGSEVERWFGHFTEQWIKQRPGNSTNYKNVRSFDKGFRPENNAVLTLTDLHNEVEKFIDLRMNNTSQNQTKTIGELFFSSQKKYPNIGIKIKYDYLFEVFTSVKTTNIKLSDSNGIQLNRLWYNNSKLNKQHEKFKKTKIEVKEDPDNPYLIHAKVDNQWIPCTNTKNNFYALKSSREKIIEGIEILDTKELIKSYKLESELELLRSIRMSDQLIADKIDNDLINKSDLSDFNDIQQKSNNKTNSNDFFDNIDEDPFEPEEW